MREIQSLLEKPLIRDASSKYIEDSEDARSLSEVLRIS